MTATPIQTDPMELIKMVNLFKNNLYSKIISSSFKVHLCTVIIYVIKKSFIFSRNNLTFNHLVYNEWYEPKIATKTEKINNKEIEETSYFVL